MSLFNEFNKEFKITSHHEIMYLINSTNKKYLYYIICIKHIIRSVINAIVNV